MTEVLFVVTVIFVAYVVYTVSGDIRKAERKTEPAAPAKSKPQPRAVVVEKRAVKTAAKTAKPAAKSAAKSVAKTAKPAAKSAAKTAKPTAPAKKADVEKSTPAASTPSGGVRDPETGEIAANPSNYRFTKRWVKEALVKEGLLDKVYKNNELDEATNEKVKEALVKFRTLEKYRV